MAECSKFFFTIQTHIIVRTKTVNVGLQRDACIEIPQASPERGTLHVLWPCSLTDRNLPDCDCSVYLAGNFRLQQCQYYNSSIYTLEIQTEELGKHKLCFKNMTSSMNNTHVHFFRETSECSPRELGFGTSRRTTFQRFISSYLIVLRGKKIL